MKILKQRLQFLKKAINLDITEMVNTPYILGEEGRACIHVWDVDVVFFRKAKGLASMGVGEAPYCSLCKF